MANILLIEPDAQLATVYAEALATKGHSPYVAHNAQAAIQTADYKCPDAVVIELQMVEHSGIEFLYEFRSYPEWSQIPVIIMSSVPPGEFTDSRQLLSGELGADIYLYKPATSLKRLISEVDQHVKSKQPAK